MQTRGILEENHCTAQHIEPHQEETSQSRLFNYPQPSSSPHNNRSMDNNIWHRSPKVDLNKFDGFDLSGWVIQMEHYFSLQGIIDDMMKLKVEVLICKLSRIFHWNSSSEQI
jgi:hypothetical protein